MDNDDKTITLSRKELNSLVEEAYNQGKKDAMDNAQFYYPYYPYYPVYPIPDTTCANGTKVETTSTVLLNSTLKNVGESFMNKKATIKQQYHCSNCGYSWLLPINNEEPDKCPYCSSNDITSSCYGQVYLNAD